MTGMTGMTGMRRRWSVLAALALVTALSGCVQIPDDGPVHTAEAAGDTQGDQDPVTVPRGPQDGESAEDVVNHFFDAMTASPMSAAVAREFLTKRAVASWSPENGYLTYEGKSAPNGNLQVTLSGVNLFDSRGRWVGTPPDGVRVVDFGLEPENGQWRISAVPDALMVSDAWFENNMQPMSIYYFDPDAHTLVPEPVFVPQGDQMLFLLIQALLEGPGDPRVERTFVPPGTKLNPLTVGKDGVVDIPLEGEIPDRTVDQMATQFAWTLRQVPTVSAVRITVDNEPLVLPGGDAEFGVDHGASYDPTGIYARGEMYGLQNGRVVRVLDDETQTLVGPFGKRDYGLRDVSVDLDGSHIAGVTRDGNSVLLSGVTGSDGLAPRTVVSGGVDILHPAWDFSDRLWVVDRRPNGAVVSVVQGGGLPRAVDVPGITGLRVIDFLVSRDGTRILAAVRGQRGDRIVVSRIFTPGSNPTLRGSRSRTIVHGEDGGEQLRIRDLAWRSATAVNYVKAVAGRQSELRSAVVDGSPPEFDPEAVFGIFGDPGARVISSPRPEEPVYLLKAGGGYDPAVPGSPRLPSDVTALTYVG